MWYKLKIGENCYCSSIGMNINRVPGEWVLQCESFGMVYVPLSIEGPEFFPKPATTGNVESETHPQTEQVQN